MNKRYFNIVSDYLDGKGIRLPKGEFMQFARFAKRFLHPDVSTGIIDILLAQAIEEEGK